jgi:predicted nucleic acid-binding Zn ribbon protein
MPLYEFRCLSTACGASFYLEGSRRRVSCPLCGSPARRQPAEAAIVTYFTLEDFREHCGPISLARAAQLALKIDWGWAYDALDILNRRP